MNSNYMTKLYIVPNVLKSKMIRDTNLNNVKYMTKEELRNEFYFSYDYNAIKYLMEKYNLKYDNAKLYIDNMYFIDNISDTSDILDLIKKMKLELLSNNLLTINKNFNYYLKNVCVCVYGYDILDNYYLCMFDEIKKITNVEIIDKSYSNKNKKFDIYEFNTMEEEIIFLAEQIITLVNNYIDINKIFITNYSLEYKNIINRIFSMYNIPINLPDDSSLLNTMVGKYFVNLLSNNTIDEIVSKIFEYCSSNEMKKYYSKILGIINKHSNKEYLDEYDIECIKIDLKNTKVNDNRFDNAVNTIDFMDNIIDDDMYIFFIGFNQGVVPKIYKNEDFLSDKIKENNNLSTSLDMNILFKEKFINKLYSTKNIVFSYKLSSDFDTYYKSNLVDELDMNIINNYETKNIFSDKYNKYLLCKNLDDLVKYGIHNTKLDSLYNTYLNNLEYITYDNKYTGINKENLRKYLNNKLMLSYTHLDNYNRCSFRYYLNNILKLNKMEESFAIKIGNLYHYILSKAFSDDFDFENEYDNYIKSLDLNSKELFLLNNLKQELIDTIDVIKYQNSFSDLDKSLYEEKVYINSEFENVKVTFNGVIDKVNYKLENNNIYVAIIDYKTGVPKLNLDYSKYGINLQLPIYLYLVKNINKFKNENIKYIGFYLQKICSKYTDTSKDIKTQQIDSLKLQGYTNSNKDLIQKLDRNFSNSQVIKSMRLSSNGFYKYAKILDENKIENLINLVENIVSKNIKSILNSEFDINPKKIDDVCVGCEFCNYKDICYKKENNVVNLKNVSYEGFLN